MPRVYCVRIREDWVYLLDGEREEWLGGLCQIVQGELAIVVVQG